MYYYHVFIVIVKADTKVKKAEALLIHTSELNQSVC